MDESEYSDFCEAISDGINYIESGLYGNGHIIYLIPCLKCGTEIRSYTYLHGKKYYCKDCKYKMTRRRGDIPKEIAETLTSAEKRFYSGILRLKEQKINLDNCQVEISQIRSQMHGRNYCSAEEVMAGIWLLKNKIKFDHQYYIKPYWVDFALPNLKIVLEIDGSFYHQCRREKDKGRDVFIRKQLGNEWEIIRIDAKLIDVNIRKLIPAINKLYEKRKAWRGTNNSQLPHNYSVDI